LAQHFNFAHEKWTRETLKARLAQPFSNPDDIVGDGTHADRLAYHALQKRSVRQAAVLVLFVEQSDGLHLVLTQRTAELKDHSGQIAFAGGRKDDADATLADAALREAKEEIGADVSMIEVLGELPRYVTFTAYEITPVVAACAPQRFTPEPGEVADVFTVPLAHFLNEANWRRDGLMREGLRREFWAVPYNDASGERYIWGATAGMLRGLALRLGMPHSL
jgi:8-oxo-dGTP pyrophosphatase MutT (NUDIX family)